MMASPASNVTGDLYPEAKSCMNEGALGPGHCIFDGARGACDALTTLVDAQAKLRAM